MRADGVSGSLALPAVAQTALWTAAARARESARPDRLFEDRLAAVLAGPGGQARLRHFHTARAPDDGNPVLPIRTRWFDDFLHGARARQVVGLGAGLDTRAYRLDWPPGTVLFEVDQPAVLAYKEERLPSDGERPRCARRAVPADLADDWSRRLVDAGFRAGVPTVWFAEGLLFYLPESVAASVLAETARLSAPGGRIALDLIGTGVFRLGYMRPFLGKLADAGSPWQFGTDEPARFATACGWRVDAVVEPGSPDANYGRWPPNAAATGPANLPRSFFLTASLA
jgi:methyltransferase (TIGR00027 family)